MGESVIAENRRITMSLPVRSVIFRFGEYEFNPATTDLTRRGTPIRLQRQPARLLHVLLSKAGDIVTRNEIRECLWRDGTTVDFEIGVNRCIRQIRSVLFDDRDAPRYIRTIPRLGYSFIAPVSQPQTTPEATSALTSPAGSSPSIVVLPFSNLTDATEDEYFCDGLTEEIINALAQNSDFRVIARTSAFAFKGRHDDIRRIAETLDVSNVLEGSVRRSGSRIRVTAQLIRASDGTHISSTRYDRETGDVFALQDEIASDIAERLKGHLAPRKRPVTNLATYEAFLEGRFHWHKLTPPGLQKSLECYRRAISLDPDYGPAHAGAAECYFALAILHLASPLDVLPKARTAAQQALALDDNIAEAHNVLGCVEGVLNYQWSVAARHFQRARELSGGSQVRLGYAVWNLLPQGNIEDAAAECEKAIGNDPFDLMTLTATASVLYARRSYEAAAEQCLSALEIDPAFAQALQWLVQIRLSQARYEEGLACARQLVQLRGESMITLRSLAIALAAAGERETALALAARIEGLPDGPRISAVFIARIHTILGDHDAAFHWLDRAVEYRVPHIAWLKSIPWTDPLRSDPRYPHLLRKINL
jgi:TolB-like protein/tetratricopeptide (TPR) repeat protein